MKQISISLSLMLLLAVTGYAQKNMFAVAWEINFPNNSDYVNKASFLGGRIDYRYFIKKNLSAGVALNWSSYEDHIPRQTFVKPDGNSAVTSDFIAQTYQLPMTATVHYYFQETKMFKPYAGVALGAQYLEQNLYYNVYITEDNNWGFVVRPELGTVIYVTQEKTWGILVGASYSYATNKTDDIDQDSFKNFGISIGVAFSY